jgi:hypothetical protein
MGWPAGCRATAATARQYPRQVKRILIHDVTCEDPDSARCQKDFDSLPCELSQILRDSSEKGILFLREQTEECV